MTARSVAFLRAINVAGRRATKDRLLAAFTGLGLGRVETYIASGNVLFEPDPSIDERHMAAALEATLGFTVETTVRTAEDLVVLATAAPFSSEDLARSESKPQIILLFDEASSTTRDAILGLETEDRFVFAERELHWLPHVGVAKSEMREVLRLLGGTTIRTAATIRRLADLA